MSDIFERRHVYVVVNDLARSAVLSLCVLLSKMFQHEVGVIVFLSCEI